MTVRITVVQSTERGNNSLESTQATLIQLQSDLYTQLLLVSNIQVIEIADSSRCTALTSVQTGLLCEAAQVRNQLGNY